MEDKLINFHIYRYHLLPIITDDKQVKLFEDKPLSFEDIKNKKNDFFNNILKNLISSKSNSHPLKLEHNEDEYYLFKLAQKKTTTITQNFENLIIDNEPYVYVIINNDPKIQKIAISDNFDAFSKPEVVKNILKKVFRRDLEIYTKYRN
ncbi:hypothetical protein [Thalassobellus suaedae]|uniref:Uncharacterized protein n=1 Tax=Thalassobellus suaedae TaxID=3074124 RepID=A0ABY9XWF9_9FLAO|nr:hypothetical protein RHP51_04450 [Flavobacteriaceae bacterium HL-DH14]